ncbi:MAG: DUF5320 domain-containing protein [Candidatus Omnitrophota bacterium]
MPGGDGTGPLGLGPMTGHAAGYCAGYPVPGYMNQIAGRGRGGFGLGRGWGRGRGWARVGFGRGFGWRTAAYGGYPYGPELNPQQEADMLKQQAKAMQEEINSINERINELESAAKKAK